MSLAVRIYANTRKSLSSLNNVGNCKDNRDVCTRDELQSKTDGQIYIPEYHIFVEPRTRAISH